MATGWRECNGGRRGEGGHKLGTKRTKLWVKKDKKQTNICSTRVFLTGSSFCRLTDRTIGACRPQQSCSRAWGNTALQICKHKTDSYWGPSKSGNVKHQEWQNAKTRKNYRLNISFNLIPAESRLFWWPFYPFFFFGNNFTTGDYVDLLKQSIHPTEKTACLSNFVHCEPCIIMCLCRCTA